MGFPILFVLGFLLYCFYRYPKLDNVSEVVFQSFFLGSTFILVSLTLFKSSLLFGVLFIILCFVFLVYVFLKYRLVGWENNFLLERVISFKPSNLFFVVLIFVGVIIRFLFLDTILPPTAVDALKFYFPWTKQAYATNRWPMFDSGMFNTPTGSTSALVSIFYWLYFWNRGVDQSLTYWVSPIYSTMAMLVLYLFFKREKDSEAGLLAVLFVSLNTSLILWDILPYAEAMLAFYGFSFFYFRKKSTFLQGLCASLTSLLKYTGFALIPMFLYSVYEVDGSKWKKVLYLSPLLPCVYFYLCNLKTYGNPFPHLVASITAFLGSSELATIGGTHGESVLIGQPINFLKTFFFSQGSPINEARILTVVLVLLSLKKGHRYEFMSLGLFFFASIVTGNISPGIRYFIPFLPAILLPYLYLSDYFGSIGYMVSQYAISFLFFGIPWILIGQYLNFDARTIELLVPSFFLSAIILLTVERAYNIEFSLKISRVDFFVFLAVGMLFMAPITMRGLSRDRSALEMIMEKGEYWLGESIYVIDTINRQKDKGGVYLLVENSGPIRSYCDVPVFEIGEVEQRILVENIYDKPEIKGVFFGSDQRRVATQEGYLGGVIEGKHIPTSITEAQLLENITVTFKDLCGTYYVVLFGKNIELQGRTPIIDRGYVKTYEGYYDGTQEFHIVGKNFPRINFIVLAKSDQYDRDYLGELSEWNITHIVLSHDVVSIYVYECYSVLSFLYLPESETVFEEIYSSNYWSIFKLRCQNEA